MKRIQNGGNYIDLDGTQFIFHHTTLDILMHIALPLLLFTFDNT